MQCMDCPNKTKFYELNNSADLYHFYDDGTVQHIESGEGYFEGWECVECGSRDVKENANAAASN